MHESTIDIIVLGAMGRMGQMVLKCSTNHQKINVIGAIEAPKTPFIGSTTGVKGINITVTDNAADVIKEGAILIDFTLPAAVLTNLPKAIEGKAKMVIGATGFTDEEKDLIKSAAEKIPIVLSPNMSIGVNLLFKLSELAAKSLGENFDIEIIEAHHKHKHDAPSGTAHGIAEAVARGRSFDLKKVAKHGREGIIGERPQDEIGIHAVRGGDIVGDHTILYAGDGERIELKHMAHSRATFANGSLKAANFLREKETGLYTMFDVLGL